MGQKERAQKLDRQACRIAITYRKAEIGLLEIICQMDRTKAFYHLGFSSLFSYVTDRLKLSEAVAYNFINVARKSHEVPELKQEIARGKITVSKAKKITPVITQANKTQWLDMAKTISLKKLEKKVAMASPKQAIREEMKYVGEKEKIGERITIKRDIPRIQLQMGIDENTMLKFRRAQDILSQKANKPCDLEDTLNELLDLYLQRHDPMKKAQRQKSRGKLNPNNNGFPSKELKKENNKHTNNKDEQKYPVDKNTKNCQLKISNKANESSFQNTNEEIKKSIHQSTDIQQVLIPVNKMSRKRKPIPAHIKHQVLLRDDGRCTHINTDGKRCSSRRHLHIHHIMPVAKGGENRLNNLTLLCAGHHKVIHCL